MTTFDIQTARRNLEQRHARRADALAARLAKAQADFAAITGMIVTKYRPRRIWQWGSLLNTRHFSEMSDIDIGIEGLQDASTIFAILEDAETMTEFPLDIVELDRMEPAFADIIRMKGRAIYERKD